MSNCICGSYSEDRGGGYYELMLEPNPECPEHFPKETMSTAEAPAEGSMFDGMKRPDCWFTENGEGIVWRPMYWPLSALALNEKWHQETGQSLNLNAADYHARSVTRWAHPSVKDLEHWPAELVSSTRIEGWIAFSTIELDVTP